MECSPVNFFQLIGGCALTGQSTTMAILTSICRYIARPRALNDLSQFKLTLYCKLPTQLVFMAIAFVEVTLSFVQAVCHQSLSRLRIGGNASYMKAATWGILGSDRIFKV